MKKKWILMIVAILSIAVLAACGDKDESKKDDSGETDGNEDIDMELPDADLDGIPDVVLEVNGEEVMKDEFASLYEQQFQQVIMQLQMSGQDLDSIDQNELKEQMAESMVDQNLLVQEANKQITDVSEDEINDFIDEFLEQTEFETKDELLAAFEEQGTDEEEFTSQVVDEIKVGQLIDNITKEVEVTEDEMNEYYELLVAQQEEMESEEDEELPEFDELKDTIEQQLFAQKKSEETDAFVETLREDADITIHL